MKKKLIKILLDARRKKSIATKPANDIYPDSNAASKWNPDELVGPWTASGGGTIAPKNIGGYYIEAKYVGPSGGEFIQYNGFPITNGHTYNIKFDANAIGTTTGKAQIWEGFVETVAEEFPQDTWTSYDLTLTANDTSGIIRVYPSLNNQVGGECRVRNFEILDLG